MRMDGEHEDERPVAISSAVVGEGGIMTSITGSSTGNANMVQTEANRKRPLEVARTSSDSSRSHISVPADESLYNLRTPNEPYSKRKKTAAHHVSPGIESLEPNAIVHGLTTSIWKKIFSVLPPVFLGRLLRVSRAFNSLLTSNTATEDSPNIITPLSSQSIWLSSRHRYAAGLPQALPDQEELDMWRLIRGSTCQLCMAQKPLATTNGLTDPWRPPWNNGLRVIWAFQVRCCMPCLLARIEQESSLLFSSTVPSLLLPALPYIFLAESKFYVHANTIKDSILPEGLHLSKVYYKPLVEKAVEEFHWLKAEDSVATQTWAKELTEKNETRARRVLNWEQWERKGGLRKVNARPAGKRPAAGKHIIRQQRSQLHLMKTDLPVQAANLPSTEPEVSQISTVHDSNGLMYASLATPQDTIYYTAAPSSRAMESSNLLSINHPDTGPFIDGPNVYRGTGYPYSVTHSTTAVNRPERNLRDVTVAKAERRAEIERRCMELVPPIPANVLCYMDSFQAALQIPQPLTDQAWELLKPRLLDQRADAEKEDKEHQAKERQTPKDVDTTFLTEIAGLDDVDHRDRAWDASQAPIRDRLSLYADEQIKQKWMSGAAVNLETCATFAADVLLYVKQRFDEDQRQADLSKATNDYSIGAEENTLILENMKWVFDNKIRPLTEPYQRELFMCNICEGTSKLYGFEAVIQHYAAKHTTALSQGSVVVHWRAKWPDQAPFRSNPGLVKHSNHSSISLSFPTQSATSNAASHSLAQAAPFLEHAAPWLRHSLNAYSTNQMESTSIGHSRPQPTSIMSPHLNHYPGTGPGLALFPGSYGVSSQPAPTAAPFTARPTEHVPQAGPWAQYVPTPPSTVPAAPPQTHQNMVSDMAQHARDLWFAISGIRDMPACVRIHVVIQHIAKRLEITYGTNFSSTMFLDGLNHNAQMRPVRSLNGLICRTCSIRDGSKEYLVYPQDAGSARTRKEYTLPLLLNHFNHVHLDGPTGAPTSQLDWKRDMIALPEPSEMLSLINAHGMDDGKLVLIAEAFPGLFPHPLPKPGTFKHGFVKYPDSEGNNHQRTLTAGHAQGHQTSRHHERHSPARSYESHRDRRSHSSTREWEPVGEDEYDPHRPAYLGRMIDSHRGSQSDGKPSSADVHVRSEPDHYDPNRPIIDCEVTQRNPRSHRKPPRIEVVEADKFLEQLQPQVGQSSGLYQPVQSRSSNRREDRYTQIVEPEFHRVDGSYDMRGGVAAQDLNDDSGSRRFYEDHASHAHRGPRHEPNIAHWQRDWSSHRDQGSEHPHEPTLQISGRYVSESCQEGFYSPGEPQAQQVHYVYSPTNPYGSEVERHPSDRARAVEYIPVESYRQDLHYVHRTIANPPSAQGYVVEAHRDSERQHSEDQVYREGPYHPRVPVGEGDRRPIYRDSR